MSSKAHNRLVSILWPLALATIASYILFIPLVLQGQGRSYSYLPINLLLSWVAFAVMLALRMCIRKKLWSSWTCLGLTAAWLFFLPNTFYMMSDYIHLQDVPGHQLLYAVAVFSSFILNSFILGLLSLYGIHRELVQRVSRMAAYLIIELIILSCSYGIYIGRELRWNTWDVVANAPSLIFDVSDRLIHPSGHPTMLPLTLGFFVFISTTYIMLWQLALFLQPKSRA